mgnify:CR=1 FL=1
MKKRYFAFMMIFFTISMSRDNVIGDSLMSSVFASIYVITSPLLVSIGASEESENQNTDIVEETYAYFKKMVGDEKLVVKDVFSEEESKKLGLNLNEKVLLSDTKMGIIVSNDKKVLAFIPSNDKYTNIITGKERS